MQSTQGMSAIRNFLQTEAPEAVTADYSQPERRAATAFRSSSILHVDTELETAVGEATAEARREEDAEARELRMIASLADHPGWQIVRRIFEERINGYRSGQVNAEAAADPKITDEELGKLTRNGLAIAGELTTLINKVELAALEELRQREEMRNATIRERVATRT